MNTFNVLLSIWIIIGFLSFCYLIYKPAPYGRHIEKGWGAEISARSGWVLMESPAFYLMLIFFLIAGNFSNIAHITLTSLFCFHYFNRSFLWPLRSESKKKKIPLSVVFSAFFFNLINVFFQGTYIFILSSYSDDWVFSIPFFVGISLFLIGFLINFLSDEIIIKQKKEINEGYFIPQGFLYKKITCPNYFGELIEWLGWAVMTYSSAGFVFFLWTLFNLLPRAISNHKWNNKNIKNYPKDRKAIIPYIL